MYWIKHTRRRGKKIDYYTFIQALGPMVYFVVWALRTLGPKVNGRVHIEQLTLSCSVRVEACSRVKQLSPGGMSGKGTGRRGVKGYSGQSVGFKSHNIPLNAT